MPAAELMLLGLIETVLAPTWVWLAIGEVPSLATVKVTREPLDKPAPLIVSNSTRFCVSAAPVDVSLSFGAAVNVSPSPAYAEYIFQTTSPETLNGR